MDETPTTSSAWSRSTLPLALVGGTLYWAALPPLGLSWLGWIAPVPWLLLVRADKLEGRRPYAALWLAGFAFWMVTLQWLRLPHPAVTFGWIVISAYLAFYLPIFIGLSRVGVQRVGLPLWLASPVVWTGLEFMRAHLLTGFLLASLAHTQVYQLVVIQVSDLVGEYGVSFLIVAVVACVTCILFRPRQMGAAVPAVVLLAAAIGYGQWRVSALETRLAANSDAGGESTRRIALIQGNSLAEWKQDPNRERQIMDEYLSLSDRAVELARERGDGRAIDLVVWPETMFRTGLVTFDAGYELPADFGRTTEQIAGYGPSDLASLVRRMGAPVLVGVDRAHFRNSAGGATDATQPALRYNTAVLVDRDGQIAGTYDKVHRVMFGEYIPFAEWMPFVYRLTPLTGGIRAGLQPVLLKSDGWLYAPSVCYETVLPHVIARQAATQAAGRPPDVLVNLTNDAWYWGSSALDLHLACGVFRAIETRTPLVIAANGGLSAWIDHLGQIRAQSTRQQPEVVLADVERGAPTTWYVRLGDWFAAGCLTCCAVLAIIGWRGRTTTP